MNDGQFGSVFLVGAGPGDPDLLTVKAHRLLSQCDVVVYDALVPREILNLVQDRCECIFVGKRRGFHSTPQVEINSILLELTTRHNIIVRLKGGDPFLFGRGGEEAKFLQQQGISIEVVPGITSGAAVPAYFGIPLTHRDVGSSVTFVTGHEGIDKIRPSVNWKSLAEASNTLVIYMGVHNLSHIVNELILGGMSPLTSAAVMQQGTVMGQRILKTTINQLVRDVETQKFVSPSIVMIGDVVNFQVESCSPDPANVTMPISF